MRDPSVDRGEPAAAGPTPAPSATRAAGRVRAWAANDGTQTPRKVAFSKRMVAFAIDGILAAVLSVVPFLGSLLAGLYLLLRDGTALPFMDRRSVGKRIMRLRPVRDDGSSVGVRVSLRRNWMLAVASLAVFLGVVPVLGFAIEPIGLAIGIVLVILEGYLATVDEAGLRWGDHLAGTRVIESES